MQEAYHGAEPQAKRSPKERSAVPGTVIMVSQVALDDPGTSLPRLGPRRRLGSASKIAQGIGTNLGGRLAPGLVVLCPDNNSLIQHPEEKTGRKKRY